MSDSLQDLRNEIGAIKTRNRAVEAEKAWETSRSRIVLVALLTYGFMVVLMSTLGMPSPWLSAFVPTAGFLLSSLSLRFIKSLWMSCIYKR